jgi:hypothetical protein
MSIKVIEPAQLGILLIDAQPLFWDFAFPEESAGKEALMVRLEHLMMLADWMELPVIASFEEPVVKNGELPERLERVFPKNGQKFAKKTYNCTAESTIRKAIERLGVSQFGVAGAETDVCVLQSVLGLLQMGYTVFLLEDCLFSSELHPGAALRRIYQSGAVPCTVKTLAYELAASTEHTPWYPEGWIEKDRADAKLFPEKFIVPEEWPPWEPVRY